MNRATLNNILFVLIGVAGIGAMVGLMSRGGQRVDDQRVSGSLARKLSETHLRQQGAHASLQARVNRLGLGGCLSATGLASTARVHECLAATDSYRALLAERDAGMAADYTEDEAVLAALPVGPVREQALQGMAGTIERMRQVRAQMTQADRANVDAVQAMLQWAAKNHAALHMSGDSLLLESHRQIDELSRLRTAVQTTSQASEAANESERRVVYDADRTQLALVRQFNALY